MSRPYAQDSCVQDPYVHQPESPLAAKRCVNLCRLDHVLALQGIVPMTRSQRFSPELMTPKKVTKNSLCCMSALSNRAIWTTVPLILQPLPTLGWRRCRHGGRSKTKRGPAPPLIVLRLCQRSQQPPREIPCGSKRPCRCITILSCD